MNKTAITALIISMTTALILLVTVILPAEYDYDPIGTGELLGVLGMSSAVEETSYHSYANTYRTYRTSFELAPFESLEIKLRLSAEGSMMFNWNSTGEIVWDLHAEPDGAPEGFAESFAAGRSPGDIGFYVARFDGVHGWFFENRLSETVIVNLEAQGIFTEGIYYRGGYPDPFDVPEN